MDRKNPVTEHALLRVSDGESLGWLSASQYDELRTLRLLTPKFEWKGTMPINLNKFNLGPNNLAGAVQQLITVPGIESKFLILAVYVTHHMLKKPEVTMVEATIKGM